MQKRYKGPDYLVAFLITLGCSVFILFPVISVVLCSSQFDFTISSNFNLLNVSLVPPSYIICNGFRLLKTLLVCAIILLQYCESDHKRVHTHHLYCKDFLVSYFGKVYLNPSVSFQICRLCWMDVVSLCTVIYVCNVW